MSYLVLDRSIWRIVMCAAFVSVLCLSAFGQGGPTPQYKTQEYSESDGIPVLIKHLPDWENVRSTTVFAIDQNELRAGLGERPLLSLIDFTAGTEVAAAKYDAGQLVIAEFTSPQASIEADTLIRSSLDANPDPTVAYKRIGNYNVLVFDVVDADAANALIDQVKYEKDVQWLGDNPFLISAERAFVLTTSDIFTSTVMIIVMGIAFSIVGGLIAGLVYFQLRDKRRAALGAYSDAGGMTRLNLDDFTSTVPPESLLRD